MLIDEAKINVKAGDGGDGIVHFYRDRWRPKGGPDGGDGGKGGDVYFQAVSDISKLHQFRHAHKFQAERGVNGGGNQCSGKNGVDLILEVPVGTIVEYDNGTSLEFTTVGQTEMIARGGKGGVGNYRFRSATNQTPEEKTMGYKTVWRALHLKLKLIADIGLIGLPNAGKTSLLNEITAAHAPVANYAFTTLEPNLGVTLGNLILADVPGLIEGASEGKGLGTRFLRHIERTRLLVHCISAESTDPKKDYQTIRTELTNYSTKLATKPEIVIVTKSDLIEPKALVKFIKSVKASLAVSIIDDKSLKDFNDLLSKSLILKS
ncbi:GTPase ObgE [Candidatus Shapirobacteria bacterium]|nr:GTPase ObgE [Candidatus Shapirobacteria bacterium]